MKFIDLFDEVYGGSFGVTADGPPQGTAPAIESYVVFIRFFVVFFFKLLAVRERFQGFEWIYKIRFLICFSWFSSEQHAEHDESCPYMRNIINYVPTKEYGIISFDVRLSEREA